MIVNQEEQLMCRQAGAVIQRDLDRQVPDIGAHGLMRPCEVWPRQSTVSQLCWSSPMHKKSPENHWVEVRGSQWAADWAWAYIKHSLQAKDTNHSLPLGAGVMLGPVLASQENKATGSSLVGQSMALSSALPSAKRAILLLSSRCEPHHFSSFFFFHMMPYGMEYPFSQFRSAVLVLSTPVSTTGRVVWEAEKLTQPWLWAMLLCSN